MNNIDKKSDILRIVKEDILEVVGRENKRIQLELMKLEVTVSYYYVSEAVKELKKEGLIKVSLDKKTKKEFIQLTEKGKIKAEAIIKKHSVLEKYFREKRKSKSEAIEATNILEHYISTEVIRIIEKLSTLKKEGNPLTELRRKEGLITDINLGVGLFERIISMGIYPGERIKVASKIPNGIIVEIKNKKFALDNKIARQIKVLSSFSY